MRRRASRREACRVRYVRPTLLLVVTAVSLYLLLPSLLAVFGSWRSLSDVDWRFALLVLGFEGASYVCVWELDRIALRTKAWFPVAAAQLGGNAVGRILPGGGATATAFTAGMLRRAGIDTGQAVAAFGASTGLQLPRAARCPSRGRSSAAAFARPARLRGGQAARVDPAHAGGPRLRRGRPRRHAHPRGRLRPRRGRRDASLPARRLLAADSRR